MRADVAVQREYVDGRRSVFQWAPSSSDGLAAKRFWLAARTDLTWSK